MQSMRMKSGRRSKTCYQRAIFTELQQIKNYAKLVAKGQLSCWNMIYIVLLPLDETLEQDRNESR